MKNIIWLASYPKSGNTWFRYFLTFLLFGGSDESGFDLMPRIPIASARQLFDRAMGVFSADLTHDEADRLRPEATMHLAEKVDKPYFIKIHDAFTHLPDGRPLIPPEATLKAIYFIRNPLDVAASLANHSGIGVDEAVEYINNPDYCLNGAVCYSEFQLRQRLLTWSGHVRSWTETDGFDVLVLRYEDMLVDPFGSFSEALEFSGLTKTEAQIRSALEQSDFSRLRRLEEEQGFKEKHPACKVFFNQGRSGWWREVMGPDLAEKIVAAHREIMEKFGYLDENERPVF